MIRSDRELVVGGAASARPDPGVDYTPGASFLVVLLGPFIGFPFFFAGIIFATYSARYTRIWPLLGFSILPTVEVLLMYWAGVVSCRFWRSRKNWPRWVRVFVAVAFACDCATLAAVATLLVTFALLLWGN